MLLRGEELGGGRELANRIGPLQMNLVSLSQETWNAALSLPPCGARTAIDRMRACAREAPRWNPSMPTL